MKVHKSSRSVVKIGATGILKRYRCVSDCANELLIPQRRMYKYLAQGDYVLDSIIYRYDDDVGSDEIFKSHPWLNIKVSTEGRIQGCSGRIGKGWLNNNGYLSHMSEGKKYSVHRLVAETFLQNPLQKAYVDHVNRNKMDNRLINLRWATAVENANNKPSEYEKQRHNCPCCTCFD